ncbi:KTSC domain-containing protein [Sphingomonas palmae]|uniref:KTSC domain-containing protein n=1 Tax=Sphingomonas palmae TaxID=1855283 RepID=UPI001C4342F2
MVYVNSSAIKRAEYDQVSRRMTLWFPQGHSYTFCGVPAHVYEGLLTAPSKGSYYNAYIRDRYQC